MANQFYFSVWKLFTSLRLWMNKDDVNLWDPKSRTGKSRIHCHLSVPQTPFWVILCHATTEETKSKLCTVTRTQVHILHTVLAPLEQFTEAPHVLQLSFPGREKCNLNPRSCVCLHVLLKMALLLRLWGSPDGFFTFHSCFFSSEVTSLP